MKHFASAAFWKAYAGLPESIRELADRSYAQLRENPRHPSLQLKKVGRFWSVRVGGRYLGRDGEALIVLLGGRTKQRQQADIDRAKALWAEYRARKSAMARRLEKR